VLLGVGPEFKPQYHKKKKKKERKKTREKALITVSTVECAIRRQVLRTHLLFLGESSGSCGLG
jgi:hypothetical protein